MLQLYLMERLTVQEAGSSAEAHASIVSAGTRGEDWPNSFQFLRKISRL